MSVRIRLARVGANKDPFFRIVAADSRRPRNGRVLEILGQYDPRKGIENAKVKGERVRHWLSCGARPSETVDRILKKARLIQPKAA